MTDPIDWEPLVAAASAVRRNAHAPYSRFAVGAAILTRDGSVFRGCNVENASFGGTLCAERGAIVQMVAAGVREPLACVVVTEGEQPASPCGFCRQVLAEFAEDMPVLLVGEHEGAESRVLTTLAELLPMAFRGAALPK